MKTTFDDFIKAFPNCSKFDGVPDAKLVFEYLSRDTSIIKMVDASESGKPALSPVAREIEELLENINQPSISFNDNFTKQAIGLMIKTILEPFGYVVSGQKNLPKNSAAKQFVSASCYRFDDTVLKPTMRIVKRIEEIG